MQTSEIRSKFREVLEGDACVHPGSVFDPISARIAEDLGFDEFWVGEHHSAGWETIPSPEMFLSAASQRTSRIKLGTSMISLPFHHPFR